MEKIYKKIGGIIILSFFLCMSVWAQTDNTYSIKGHVVDVAGKQGFAGVQIGVVNLKISAMTDENGDFEIKVPRMDVTLTVSAPGYQSQMVPVKGRSEIEIRLLGETGVASFYDDYKFAAEGAYSSSINSFSQNIVSIDEDISTRMSGQLRGIAHSGTPGSGSALFIRGLNSLNASSQPLYVVDGVVWQQNPDVESIHSGFDINPLALIDPNDVEKITVLKGGNSIYGSKGANGVILIETKRARSQATEISANISFGYRSPFKSIPVMSAEDYRLYASDIIGGAFQNTSQVNKFNFLNDDKSQPANIYNAYHNNTNWLDKINKGAMMQNYGISVRGGDDIALYAFSLGYNKTDGNIDETSYDRLNIRFNSDINLTKRLKLAFDISFTQSSNKLRNDGIDSISSPYYLSLIKSPLYSPYEYNRNGTLSSQISDTDELNVGNPYSIINLGLGESKQYGLNASIRPSYTFGEDKVKLSLLFSYGWKKLDENSFLPNHGVAEYPLYNTLGDVYAFSSNSVVDRMDRHSSIILDGRADWNVYKNELNYLNLFGGYRFYSDSYDSHYYKGHNTGSDYMTEFSKTDKNLRDYDSLDDNWKSMSWYINGDYTFLNRYLVNVSAALDASSRFGKEAGSMQMGGIAWAPFGSVNVGWIASAESFMKDVKFIDYLKLSLGYGTSGNDNLPNYGSRTYFSSVKYRYNTTGLVMENIGNEDLKWETTLTGQAGIDISMFNNRWSVSGQVYTSETRDLLTRKSLNDVAGVQYYWSNDGTLENKGYEIATNVRVINTRDLKIDFGGMIGHYKNKITSLNTGAYITEVCGAEILTKEGQPAGVFYGYKTKGVFSTKEEAAAAGLYKETSTGAKVAFEAGDVWFEDVVQDGIIRNDREIGQDDRQIIGDPNPDFYGNFNLGITYKRFTLGALFTYSYGNDVYDALRASLESGSSIYNQSKAMRNRWTADGQITSMPRATYGDPMGNSSFSDRWIDDGSYLKFKSLSLSYELPLNLTFLQGITVWGSVNNLYTFTKYLGVDPECAYGNNVLYQGVDAGLTPQTRSFNFGVKINL